MEEWRPVKDSRGYYEVSNIGRVRNKRTGRIRKVHTNQGGTRIIKLAGYQYKTFSVARLVAEAFISDNIKSVRHRKDIGDDRVENLIVEENYDERTDH